MLYEDDKIIEVRDATDLDQFGQVMLNETFYRPFFHIRKQIGGGIPLFLSEMDRFVDVSFNQITVDWNKPNGDGRYTEVSYPAR